MKNKSTSKYENRIIQNVEMVTGQEESLDLHECLIAIEIRDRREASVMRQDATILISAVALLVSFLALYTSNPTAWSDLAIYCSFGIPGSVLLGMLVWNYVNSKHFLPITAALAILKHRQDANRSLSTETEAKPVCYGKHHAVTSMVAVGAITVIGLVSLRANRVAGRKASRLSDS